MTTITLKNAKGEIVEFVHDGKKMITKTGGCGVIYKSKAAAKAKLLQQIEFYSKLGYVVM